MPWKKLALLLGTMLALLSCLEVALRIRVQRTNRETLEAALIAAPKIDGPATMGQIIRPSPDDRIAYELHPNLSGVTFKAAGLETNRHGFRSADIPLEAPAGGVTVVGVGDSIMFGHGVEQAETYMELLGGHLREAEAGIEWRVVNTGVPGYNTVMEVATLEEKALGFDPDLVIVGLCSNDYSPPNFVRPAEDPWSLTRSYLLDFIHERINGDEPGARFRSEALVGRGGLIRDGGVEPARYADLYGREAFRDALVRLRDLGRREGFRILVFLMYAPPSRAVEPAPEAKGLEEAPGMLEVCRELGFDTFSLMPDIERAVESMTGAPFSWDGYKESLAVSARNTHPNPTLHALAARRLFEQLKQSGALAELTRRE